MFTFETTNVAGWVDVDGKSGERRFRKQMTSFILSGIRTSLQLLLQLVFRIVWRYRAA
jgi:hypothetical protein